MKMECREWCCVDYLEREEHEVSYSIVQEEEEIESLHVQGRDYNAMLLAEERDQGNECWEWKNINVPRWAGEQDLINRVMKDTGSGNHCMNREGD